MNEVRELVYIGYDGKMVLDFYHNFIQLNYFLHNMLEFLNE